jgi:hypothetical protein
VKGQTIEIGDREDRIAIDVKATRRLYSALGRPASESCACVECRGFVANRRRALPAAFRSLMRRMGIDWTNEGELWALAGPRDFYVSGEFDFVGEVLTPYRTLSPGARKPFDYAFTNAAALRSIETARDLRLGSVASVRFGAMLQVEVHPAKHWFDFDWPVHSIVDCISH